MARLWSKLIDMTNPGDESWPPWRDTGRKLNYYDDLSIILIICLHWLPHLRLLYVFISAPCAWLPAVRTYGWQKYLEILPPEPKRRKFIPLYIIGGAALLIALCTFINWALYIIIFGCTNAAAPPQDANAVMLTQSNWPKLVYFFATAVVITPIYEEIIFRLILPRIIMRGFPYAFAAFVSSLVFAGLHGPFFFVPAMFYFAITQCAIQRYCGTLTAIATHALYNTYVFFVLT